MKLLINRNIALNFPSLVLSLTLSGCFLFKNDDGNNSKPSSNSTDTSAGTTDSGGTTVTGDSGSTTDTGTTTTTTGLVDPLGNPRIDWAYNDRIWHDANVGVTSDYHYFYTTNPEVISEGHKEDVATDYVSVVIEESTGNYEDAIIEAYLDDKIVMLDVFGTWCYWCNQMDEHTYSYPDVINTVGANFVAIKADEEAVDWIQQYWGVGAFPMVIFFKPYPHHSDTWDGTYEDLVIDPSSDEYFAYALGFFPPHTDDPWTDYATNGSFIDVLDWALTRPYPDESSAQSNFAPLRPEWLPVFNPETIEYKK